MPATRMRTPVLKAVLRALCGGLLASCAAGADSQLAQRAQSEMIGLPKQQLLACAGYPDHQAARNGKEYLTFRLRASGAFDPSASLADGARSSTSVALGTEFDPSLVAGGGGGCVVTIVLSNDAVEQVAYPAGAWLSDCAPVVRNCVVAPPNGQ